MKLVNKLRGRGKAALLKEEAIAATGGLSLAFSGPGEMGSSAVLTDSYVTGWLVERVSKGASKRTCVTTLGVLPPGYRSCHTT